MTSTQNLKKIFPNFVCASQKVQTLTTTYLKKKLRYPTKKDCFFGPSYFETAFARVRTFINMNLIAWKNFKKTLCLYICSTLYLGLGWANFEIYLSHLAWVAFNIKIESIQARCVVFFIDSEDLKKRPKPNKKNTLDCSEDGELIKKFKKERG